MTVFRVCEPHSCQAEELLCCGVKKQNVSSEESLYSKSELNYLQTHSSLCRNSFYAHHVLGDEFSGVHSLYWLN